ncbi:hypothetical protein ACFYOV_32885 [Streptomyces sp. NPDC005931]|uniref:hypothetical protein n=1 Tax=Streptomyces sp. NPDC005931 TaxID=3364737 RepID=UPI0036A4F969
MTAEQLPLDCEPTWRDTYTPSDRTPSPHDLRHAELHDLKDQGTRLAALYTAHTIPITGSYL